MKTKKFQARVLLTVTTGRLLTAPNKDGNGIGALYELLGWMTDDSPSTHQLPRFSRECKPWLLRWFPELTTADSQMDNLDRLLANAGQDKEAVAKAIDQWLAGLAEIKRIYNVPAIPADDHDRKDPVEEAVQMFGKDRVIVVRKED